MDDEKDTKNVLLIAIGVFFLCIAGFASCSMVQESFWERRQAIVQGQRQSDRDQRYAHDDAQEKSSNSRIDKFFKWFVR